MTQNWRGLLGPLGIWRSVSMVTPGLAAELERLGYGALWLGGSPRADLAIVDRLLTATSELVVATGIVNMWQSDAHEVAASYARIESRHPGRFLLGVGAGHREATTQYAKPYDTIAAYADVLLADGAHPYLVTPAYVEQAREVIGAGPLLAVEHKAVIESDPQAARAIGRPRVHRPYLGLVNYTNNLRRLGWTDDDLAGEGSDALIDALVAHGNPDQVAAQLSEFIGAGADHVCVQLLQADADTDPLPGYRQLAAALELG